MTLEPFSFFVKGETLFGVTHGPIVDRFPDWCVIILAGPGTNRCGPHRLHIDISRMLCTDGLKTFRFDFRGRGESSGDPLHLTVYTMIEDLLGLMEYLRHQYPRIRNCLLIANCLSCVSALKFFEADNFVKSCVLLGAQELHDRPIIFTRLQELYGMLKKYAGKTTRIETWKKVLRAGVDLKQVGTSFTNVFPERFVSADPGEKKRLISLLKGYGDKTPVSKSVYFIYGSNDPLKNELRFYEKYARKHSWDFHSAIIKDADRTFTGKQASETLLHYIHTYGKQVIGRTVDPIDQSSLLVK